MLKAFGLKLRFINTKPFIRVELRNETVDEISFRIDEMMAEILANPKSRCIETLNKHIGINHG
jgi:hypothetical protein